MLTGRLRVTAQIFTMPNSLAAEQRVHVGTTLSKQLRVKILEDFYGISRQRIDKMGSDAFINIKQSMSSILMRLYPNYDWVVYRFSSGVPNGYWDDVENHRHFFDYLAELFQFHDLDGWYDCTTYMIAENGGGGMINDKYNGSVSSALEKIYPERDWKPWLFRYCPMGVWDGLHKQQSMCDYVCECLALKTMDDMYSLTTNKFRECGGGSLLALKYKGSLFRLLTAVYPQKKWLHYEFTSISQGYWNDPENVLDYLKDLESLFEIEHPADWYRVGNVAVGNHGGRSLLSGKSAYRYPTCLKLLYKDYDWDWNLFRSTVIPQRVSQRGLITSLKTLLAEKGISVKHKWK